MKLILKNKRLYLLFFIFFPFLFISHFGCGFEIVCKNGISNLTINPNKSPCTEDCECNTQFYEGRCIEGVCTARKRDECNPGDSRKCTSMFDNKCQGRQECQDEGLMNLVYGDCKCLNKDEQTTKESIPITESTSDDAGSPDSSRPEISQEKQISENSSTDEHTCKHQCSTNQSECKNGKIRSCITDKNRCHIWTTFKECPSGFCSTSSSCGTCNNQCSSGQAECKNGKIRSCTTDKNGCHIWTPFKKCPDGFCSTSSSCGTCNHQCSAKQIECKNGQIRSCTTDKNGCRIWAPFKNCPDGFCATSTSCGVCNHQCSANQIECKNGQIRSCTTDKKKCRIWTPFKNCPDGFCATSSSCGTCNHQCSTNQSECKNGQIRSCTTDNHGCRVWAPFKNCSDGFCATSSSCGTCNNQCSAGQAQCTNGQLRSCTTDKNGCRIWTPFKNCPNNFCATSTSCGSCNHQCSPGQTQCNNGKIRSCTTDNHGCRIWSSYKNCPSGSICLNNKCVPQQNSGLVAYWKFDEGSGTTAKDSSGHNRNGTLLSGASWTKGKIGYALRLNGGNNRSGVKTANTSQLLLQKYTIQLWVKRADAQSHGYMLTKGRSGSSSSQNMNFSLHFNAQGKIECSHEYGSNDTMRVYSKTNLQAKTWYHIALTYDGKVMKLYINGKLDNSTTKGQPPTPCNNVPIVIGNIGELDTAPKADIDEVMIFNYARSAQEIQQSAAAGNQICFKKDSYTLALWQFDGNLKDETGRFNATMNKPIQSSQWVQGVCDKALNFNQNYFSNFKFINPLPTSFSIEARIRLNKAKSHSIIAGHERQTRLTLMIYSSGIIEFNWTKGSTQYKVNSKTHLQPNIWYLLKATYTQQTKKMELYINGKLDNSSTIPVSQLRLPSGGSSEPILVGAYISCVGSSCNYANYLDGAISALKISATYPSEVLVKSGSFKVGSQTVKLTNSFYIWKHEITQTEFKTLMGYNPSKHQYTGQNYPVEQVTWDEALAFCNALSKSKNLPLCFTCTGSKKSTKCTPKSAYLGKNYYKCKGYRLPTEAEWEYAYRAGTTTDFYNGKNMSNSMGPDPNLDPIAWYLNNSGNHYHPVGLKQPNRWNIFDMGGNLREWTFDCLRSSYPASTQDPIYYSKGCSLHVNRGGAFNFYSHYCKISYRSNQVSSPGYRAYVGFRPVRTQ